MLGRRILTESSPEDSITLVQDHTERTEIKEPLTERSDRYGSESTTLQRLLSTFGATNSYIVVHARKEEQQSLIIGVHITG